MQNTQIQSALRALIMFSCLTSGLTSGQHTPFSASLDDRVTWQITQITGRVAEIFPETGILAIQNVSGERRETKVDRSIDLHAFDKGELVTVDLFAGQILELRSPVPSDRSDPLVVQQMNRPPEGVSPRAGGLRQIKALATIRSVNRTEQLLTIRGPENRLYTLYATDPVMLDACMPGQEAVVVFTEGIIASIQKRAVML